MVRAFFLGVIFFTSASVWADQCAYITEKQAEEALELVQQSKEVHHFCEPCGDDRPSLIEVLTAGIQDVNYEGCWALYVNEEIQDLAYTYVEGMNISKLLGMESHDVSDEIF